MKYAFILIAAVAALFVAVPSSAEARDYCAGDRRIITYSHGRPVYAVYQIIGYDSWGRPIGHWVTIGSSYGHSSGYRGGYCPPTRYPSYRGSGYGYSGHHHSPYYGRGSGLNLSFSFGR
jgi:hypothetical protein